MSMLFVALADAHQKHDLHIRKSGLLNMPSSCMRTDDGWWCIRWDNWWWWWWSVWDIESYTV